LIIDRELERKAGAVRRLILADLEAQAAGLGLAALDLAEIGAAALEEQILVRRRLETERNFLGVALTGVRHEHDHLDALTGFEHAVAVAALGVVEDERVAELRVKHVTGDDAERRIFLPRPER